MSDLISDIPAKASVKSDRSKFVAAWLGLACKRLQEACRAEGLHAHGSFEPIGSIEFLTLTATA